MNYSADLVAATAVAKRHCAAYERIAEFREAAENEARFDCVVP